MKPSHHFYVQVVGPLDAVYVGPFYSRSDAHDHATGIVARHSPMFDTAVMTQAEVEQAQLEYGMIPMQSPDAWPLDDGPEHWNGEA
jgi:hypothetical protein